MSLKIISNIKKVNADALVKFNDESSVDFIDGKWNIVVVRPTDREEILKSYSKAINIAIEKECNSVVIPICKICKLEDATEILKNLSSEYDIEIFLFLSKRELSISKRLYENVKSYIRENYRPKSLKDLQRPLFEENLSSPRSADVLEYLSEAPSYRLDDMLKNLDAGFSETLLELIKRSGKTEAEIYKKANISRKLFSKIRNNKDYRPSKKTAIAFALALELDLEETEDFLNRAGYALSRSKKFDVIVEYFITNKNYDIFELNEVLYAFDQPLIGY